MSAVAAVAAVMVPAPRPSAGGGDAVDVLPGVYVPEARQGSASAQAGSVGEGCGPGGLLGFGLVRGAGQEVVRTGSRRAQPRAWVRAVVWLVGAGLHPKANGTTLSLAEDLVVRMDYRRGIVLYDLEGTARRLGVSVATVKRHAAVLRELGALVWLVHGSKRNLRVPGQRYTATATVYGAVIPPVYDQAMGHQLSGSGYEARVVGVTQAGRERAVQAAIEAAGPVDNPGSGVVENCSSQQRAPHSLGGYPQKGKAEVVGGLKDTSRQRASRSTASTSPTTASRTAEPRRTVWQVARDIALARQVRPLVGWTQSEGLRRLAFALRPLVDQGMQADDIAVELHSWHLCWRPARPAAYITARLRQQPVLPSTSPTTHAPQDNPGWRAWCEQQRAAAAMRELINTAALRTDADRQQARAAALHHPQRILDHIADSGLDDAFDLYGAHLTAKVYGLGGSSRVQLGSGWGSAQQDAEPSWKLPASGGVAGSGVGTALQGARLSMARGRGRACMGWDGTPCGKPAVTTTGLCFTCHGMADRQARHGDRWPDNGLFPACGETVRAPAAWAGHHGEQRLEEVSMTGNARVSSKGVDW